MFLIQRLSVAVLAFCAFSMGMSQSQSSSDFWGKVLADAYELQMRRVQESLPPHSALPPLLDLRDAVQFFQRDPKFENKYKAAIFTKPLKDPGVSGPETAASIGRTFVDGVGPSYIWPVTLSDVILIGEPTESAALLSDSHTLVYSRFSIKILEILKKKIDAHVGSQFNAVKLGGSIRFPSGHVATFLFPGYGFPGLGRRYFFFLIKAHGTETFMVSSLFSIEGESVFPVNEVTKARYSRGLPLNEFNAHLRAAIRENVDVTDGRDVEP